MKRVLMDIDTNLFRLALLENGEPVEFYVERKQTESLVGNVYAGRVETVVPNLQAAFVDIGTGKNGYLYYGNARAASGAGGERCRRNKGSSPHQKYFLCREVSGTPAK